MLSLTTLKEMLGGGSGGGDLGFAMNDLSNLNASGEARFDEKADVDLTNTSPSQAFKDMSVTWGLPDYEAGISVSQGFIAPCDGVFFGGVAKSGDAYIYVRLSYPDGTLSNLYYRNRCYASSQFCTANVNFVLPKGYIVTELLYNSTTTHIQFYPLKGVNNA